MSSIEEDTGRHDTSRLVLLDAFNGRNVLIRDLHTRFLLIQLQGLAAARLVFATPTLPLHGVLRGQVRLPGPVDATVSYGGEVLAGVAGAIQDRLWHQTQSYPNRTPDVTEVSG